MTERAQALEAIRERLKNFETVKHAMDRIGNTPLATTRYVEDVKTLLDLLAVQPPPPVGSPTRAVKLGVVEFHPQHDLRERFYAVVDDLRASGSIVDLWLMDIAAVLKEFDYDMQITTRKPKP